MVKLIERLLKGQTRLAKTVDLDDRLHIGFLGTVTLPDNMNDIDHSTFDSIKMVRFTVFNCCVCSNANYIYLIIFSNVAHRGAEVLQCSVTRSRNFPENAAHGNYHNLLNMTLLFDFFCFKTITF